MKQYLNLLNDIIENGNDRGDRTGTGTRSVFGTVIRHDMSDGFPLLTTKKMATKQMLSELWWLMRGQTNIKPMVDENNYIWVGDAYKNYCKIVGGLEEPWTEVLVLEDHKYRLFTREEFIQAIKDDFVVNNFTKQTFSQAFGELGDVYGKQWRNVSKQVRTHLQAYKLYLDTWSRDYYFPQNCNEHFPIDEYDVVDESELYTPYTFEEFYEIITGEKDYEMFMIDDHGSYPIKFSQVYGNTTRIDQLQNAIDKIINNPEDRRIMVNSWNVAQIDNMVLPPCHYNYQLYVQDLTMDDYFDMFFVNDIEYPNSGTLETLKKTANIHNLPTKKVSLMWNQRSCDTALGTPFNLSSYATLLEIICELTNTRSGELIGIGGDTHLYNDHIEIAKEQMKRPTHKLCSTKIPKVDHNGNLDKFLELVNWSDIEIIGYESEAVLKYPLSN